MTLTELLARDPITIESLSVPTTTTKDEDGWEHYRWSVRLKFEGRTLDLPYRMGTAHVHATKRTHTNRPAPVAPDVATVVSSLVLETTSVVNALGFDDWASEFGYDTDSRKAEQMFHECGNQAAKLRTFLGAKFTEYLESDNDV